MIFGASFRSPLRPVGGGVAVCVGSESVTVPLRAFFDDDGGCFDGSGLGRESESAVYSLGTVIEFGDEARRRDGSTGGKGRLGLGEK